MYIDVLFGNKQCRHSDKQAGHNDNNMLQTRLESKLKLLYKLQAALKLLFLALVVSSSSAEWALEDQLKRAAEKQDALIASFSISMFCTTCWEKVINRMFEIKCLTQVAVIIKTNEM